MDNSAGRRALQRRGLRKPIHHSLHTLQLCASAMSMRAQKVRNGWIGNSLSRMKGTIMPKVTQVFVT